MSDPDNPYPRPDSHRRKGLIEQLVRRDGSACWLCGGELHYDYTVEHLIPKSAADQAARTGVCLGASWNLVLAHRHCNALLGARRVGEKLALRDAVRERGLHAVTLEERDWTREQRRLAERVLRALKAWRRRQLVEAARPRFASIGDLTSAAGG